MSALMERFVARPHAMRFVSVIGSGCLIAIFVAIAVALPPDVRSQFTWEQTATLIGFIGVAVAILHGMARSRVVADESGLTVVNGYRKRRYGWGEVDGIGYKDGAPWPEARLTDGSRVLLFAVQSSDGRSAREAVKRLRAFLG